MIPVTKPFMPPHKEYLQYLEGIWEREYLTNNGPLVQELEERLREYLSVEHLLFVSNGTIALQLAIKALGLKGEIITTPFSYVATISSIVWEGCKPVFVDINPSTLNINPKLIEDAITEETTAILATHVFGNPCDIEAIQKIANRHGLKVIYDAAHCFGTKYKGESIYNFGDISTASFHATKIFHTVEGGAVVSNNREVIERVAYMRNFGHDGPNKFNGVGINGKNSEIHAAMGLCNLKYIDEILAIRKRQSLFYNKLLEQVPVKRPKIQPHAVFNHAYYAILFDTEEKTVNTLNSLESYGISPRRYFYPSLTELDYVDGECPISLNLSKHILCLPLYHDLSEMEQNTIVSIIENQHVYA